MAVWRGVVTRVTPAGVWVTVPKLSLGTEFGPCPSIGGGASYSEGDKVALGTLEGRRDDLVVLGLLH